MNLGIWGPSNGLLWRPETVSLKPPFPGISASWVISLHCRTYWVSPAFSSLLTYSPPLLQFPNFMDTGPLEFNANFLGVPTFSLPTLLPQNESHPDYYTWMGSAGSGSWQISGDQWSKVWCENNPASPVFTDGEINLELWPDIDLASFPAIPFRLHWPEYSHFFPDLGGGHRPKIPGESANLDFKSPAMP